MSEISTSARSSPLTALRTLLLTHTPPVHARMTAPTYQAKYLRVAEPITDAALAAHLAGDSTLACVLQHDGVAQVAACDIDSGGEAMVRRVMQAAELRACRAYGFVLATREHDGGHVWIFFARPHAAHDLQVLMRDIVTEARCPSTEVYPNHADLRLPFGVHRHSGRRGTLLLHSAAMPLDLDVDLSGALTTFLSTVQHTSDMPVRVAQEAQVERRAAVLAAIASARPRRVDPDAHWREVITQFNTSTDLVALLEGYGGRVAYHYAGGKVLMHCANSQDHAHGDAHASLVVEPGRGHQSGRMICGCYSPTCRLHNRPGQVMDAFEVYCRLEGISKRDAVQRLQAGQRMSVAPPAASPAAGRGAAAAGGDAGTPSCVPVSVVTPREQAVQQQLIAVQADRRVALLDRRLFAYVIRHGAAGQGLTNAALAAALGVQPDSIKRAKRRLRTLGYIDVAVSTDGRNPSVIRLVGAGDVPACNAEETTAGGVTDQPPPFHVESKITCDAMTPVFVTPVSSVAVGTDVAVVPALPLQRRRQGVLRGMLRAGGSARQQRAWQAEWEQLERACVAQEAPHRPQEPVRGEDVAGAGAQGGALSVSGLRLACADAAHLPLTDAQVTALLRDVLEAQGDLRLRPLLARVSWQWRGDTLTLVCVPGDLQVATGALRTASGVAFGGILPEWSGVVRVQLGCPAPVELCPTWILPGLWQQVPHWLRPLLVGSTVVDQKLYGATPAHTAQLVAAAETVQWFLDEVDVYTTMGYGIDSGSSGGGS